MGGTSDLPVLLEVLTVKICWECDEFDFIPVTEPKHNRSPIVLLDHKLGIELWSVKLLYQYAYHTLMEWRSKKSHKFIEPPELSCLTRAAVLVNAECYTAWNIRKELVESGDISLLEELKLSALVLTKHPKSSETFIHRRWVLGRYVDGQLQSSQGSTLSTGSHQDGFISMDAIDLDLEHNQQRLMNGHNDIPLGPRSEYQSQMRTELEVCRCAAEKYPSNYYAWSYRIWLLQQCYNCSPQILLSELQSSEVWVSRHISDHCGYHYRQFLLASLGRQCDQVQEQFAIHYSNLLHKEQVFIVDLITTYPGHEAMWNHRKFVFHALYSLSGSECKVISGDDDDLVNHQKKTRLENDRQILEQKEIDSVTKNELRSNNSQQKRLAQQYLDWIQKVLGA